MEGCVITGLGKTRSGGVKVKHLGMSRVDAGKVFIDVRVCKFTFFNLDKEQND